MNTCGSTTRSDKYDVAGVWTAGVHLLLPGFPQSHYSARDLITQDFTTYLSTPHSITQFSLHHTTHTFCVFVQMHNPGMPPSVLSLGCLAVSLWTQPYSCCVCGFGSFFNFFLNLCLTTFHKNKPQFTYALYGRIFELFLLVMVSRLIGIFFNTCIDSIRAQKQRVFLKSDILNSFWIMIKHANLTQTWFYCESQYFRCNGKYGSF